MKTRINQKNIVLTIVTVVTLLLVALRFIAKSPEDFGGNIFSTFIFVVVLVTMTYLFLTKKYESYLLIWITFFYASPIIKIPGLSIGPMGLLNIVFLPLMILTIFRIKNKYYVLAMVYISYAVLNSANLDAVTIFSTGVQTFSSMVFFIFALHKCKDYNYLFKGVVLISSLNLILSYYQIIYHPQWGMFQDWRGIRIYGNVFQPNLYSFFLIPSITILYYKIRTHFTFPRLLILLAIMIANIFTFSRGGLLSLLVGLIVFESLYNEGIKPGAKKIMLGLTIFLIILIGGFSSTNDHLNANALEDRTRMWKSVTPYLAKNYFIGNGLASMQIYQKYFFGGYMPHNTYLAIFFELGILGLAIILLWIAYAIHDSFKLIKIKKTSNVGIIILSLLLAMITYGMFSTAIFSQLNDLHYWILMGTLIGHTRKND